MPASTRPCPAGPRRSSLETTFPVSVKGVLLDRGRAVLLWNERGEWELPGGRLEAGETPQECVVREVLEESNLKVRVGPLLDAWVFEVVPGSRVLVLAYGCFVEDFAGMAHSVEHSGVRFFGLDQLGGVALPDGYARVVRAWASHPAASGSYGL